MKKLIYCAAALATALFAGSCQRELLDPAQGDTVIYTVNIPDAAATKTIGDGTNVNKVVYAVYRVTGETEDVAKITLLEEELMYQKVVDVNTTTGTAEVPLEVMKNQDYLVLFWAQVDKAWFDADSYHFGTAGIRYPGDYTPNDDKYAAFSGVEYISVNGAEKRNITLTRPFGQLNIATKLPNPDLFTPVITGTKVTVDGAATYYDVATGKGIEGKLEFQNVTPLEDTFTGYDEYLSMNYVFVPDQKATVTVEYVIETQSHGTVSNEISYVPIQKNYKTNIIGNLLTSKVNYEVELKRDWTTPDKDVHVVEADNIQTVLDNAVPGTTIQLKPGVNYGTLVFRQNASSKVVDITDAGGDAPGNEKYRKIEDLTIVGAEGAVIDGFDFQVGWINGSGASYIDVKNLTVEGVTFSGKKTPFNFEGAKGSALGIDGLSIVGCEMNDEDGTDRFVFQQISGYKVLNDKTTNKYVMTTGIKNLTITECEVTGAYMVIESRAMENLTITKNTFKGIKARDMLITSDTTYYPDKTYTGNITITKNTSIEGEERFIRGSLNNSDAVVVIKDNNIINYKGADADYIKVEGGNNVTNENNVLAYTATTASELASLVNNATQNITVVFAADLEGKIELWQNAPINVTINGNNKKYTGAIRIINIGGTTDRSMAIKNVNFDGTGLSDKEGCIYTTINAYVDGVKYNSYTANVSVEDCTFTGSGVAAIRHNEGGDINWTLKKCTVDETMHSFLQLENTKVNLNVMNCTVKSKNGANLNSTCNATFTGCQFDVQGYAVRVGASKIQNYDDPKSYTFTDCTLKSANDDGDAVVIIRKDAEKATLNFNNTELIGDPQIIGYTTYTKINGIELPQQDNEIRYTATAKVDAVFYDDRFGTAEFVSNVWDEATGKGIITFNRPLTQIGTNAFNEKANLTSVSLPNSVTTIGEDAFYKCTNLTSVKFNSGLKTIGYRAFQACGLTNVVIPEGVTSIGINAFNSCTSMASVIISTTVTEIGNYAFNGCPNTLKAYCKQTTPPTVGSTPFPFWASIYVPAESLDIYKAAWGSNYENIYAE